MALEDKGQAPYAPGKAVLAVIEHVRDKGFPSGPIDQEYLAPMLDIGDSYARRTLRTLEQLDLVEPDTGKPTPVLEKIQQEGTPDLPGTLAEWFNIVYEPVLRYVTPQDDIETVADQFRRYSPAGQRARMVQLFFALAEAAGLIEDVPRRPRGIHASKPASGKGTRTKKKAPTPPPKDKRDKKPPPADTAKERYLDLLIGLAENTDGQPDPALLDRIEKVLGVPRKEEVSP